MVPTLNPLASNRTRPAPTMAAAGMRWSARITAALLALFWGVFFVEHLSEWFVRPADAWPPARVWVVLGFHALMLVGLLAMLRWGRLGALVTALGTIGFFLSMQTPRGLGPSIVLVSLVPPALWLGSLALRPRAAA